jgi:hypothetical protein
MTQGLGVETRVEHLTEHLKKYRRVFNPVSGRFEDTLIDIPTPIKVATQRARVMNSVHNTLTNLNNGELINTHHVDTGVSSHGKEYENTPENFQNNNA